MWHLSLSYWEFVLRAVIVYAFLLVLIRLTGKRQVGQLAPFDLILLLVLSNALQNSMNGGDNSITAGFILATTLVALNYFVALITYKSKKIERIIEGVPIVLVKDGKILYESMKRVKLTIDELDASLRGLGFCGPSDVRFAILENNGSITAVPIHH